MGLEKHTNISRKGRGTERARDKRGKVARDKRTQESVEWAERTWGMWGWAQEWAV